MTGPVQEVDIPALTTVATRVGEAAATLAKARSDHGPQLSPAGALDGWATGPALAQGAEGWLAFLTDLHQQVQEFGAGLSQSARDYQAADQAAADRANGVYSRGPR